MIKRTLLSLLLLAIVSLMTAQAADLFFSEYVEGSSNNKALEIFNGTGAAVDLSDYTVHVYSNGSSTPHETNFLEMSGTLAHGDVYVIANPDASAQILAISDETSTVTYYNGDDAVAIYKESTSSNVDVIGRIGEDPGTFWPVAGVADGTKEHTLVRKPSIIQGNLDWTASAGTNADDSEWIVYDQDYIADLGMHTFEPGGGDNAATPTFNPPAGVYSQPISVTISSETAGASIYYTLDGSDPTDSSTPYTAPLNISTNTTVKARAYADEMDPSYVATAIYSFPVMVNNIAALRASNADATTIYHLSGEVVLTFQQDFRNQKFIQDVSGAILIDDYNGIITTTYNVADGITGITGTLNRYTTRVLQFTPTQNTAPATSTGNTIYTPTVTIADINSNIELYQSRLVRLNDVHFVNPGGNFANGQSYDLADATGSLIFRTQFYDVDYIGTAMPAGVFDLRAIVIQYNDLNQVTPRFLADFNPSSPAADETAAPATTQLVGNYPNPFNPSTTISFYTAKAEPVQITIYNKKGQAVKTWNLDSKAVGYHSVEWDGRDDNGSPVSSGVYLYRMYSGKYSSTRKMVLMK